MADYYPLVSRAVSGLEDNSGASRRGLYDRAREALLTQLRGVTPPLNESEITRERLALEEAIRKVEGEQAKRSRLERTLGSKPRPQPAPAAADAEHEPPAAQPRSDSEPPNPPAGEPTTDSPAAERAASTPALDEVAPEEMSAPAAKEISPPPEDIAPDSLIQDLERPLTPPATVAPIERRRWRGAAGSPPELKREEADEPYKKDETPAPETSHPVERQPTATVVPLRFLRTAAQKVRGPVERQVPPGDVGPSDDFGHAQDEADADFVETPPKVSRQLLASGMVLKAVIAVVAIIVVGAISAGIYRHRDKLGELYTALRGPPAPASHEQARIKPKIEDRVASGPTGAVASAVQGGRNAPSVQPPPAVAQRVVLYEEDPNDPNGKRYVGSVIWRTDTVSPGAGLAPELAVKANVEIPERHFAMTFSMVRNTDPALPASHTIDIRFKLPPDFPGGGVSNVPGILMKQTEQARGVPLAGLAVKVTDNVFLIGLSSIDTDVERNTQLLKERPWFDIPIVYSNGSRAILAMEKGTAGERAFSDAFTAWGKTGTAAR